MGRAQARAHSWPAGRWRTPTDTHLHMCLVCVQTHALPDVGLGRKAREVDWIGCACVHTSQATATQALLCCGQGRGVHACFCTIASCRKTH